jgi:hypothetical protein
LTEAPVPRAAHARTWIGVSGTVDFVVMPAANDVCKLTAHLEPQNSDNLYCTSPSGSDFPSAATNAHFSAPGAAGHVNEGVQAGDVRVLLALDDAVADNFLVGARLGYVLNAYTGDAAIRDGRALGPKVHAELRLTYVFGRDPLSHEGFAPIAFFGGGISEFDAHTSTLVTLDNVTGAQPASVWLTDAPFFLTVGGGARYQVSPRIQFTLSARLNTAFHGNGFLPTLGPELTIQYGF